MLATFDALFLLFFSTIRFDLFDEAASNRTGQIGRQFWCFISQINPKIKAAENQSESRILLLTQLGAGDLKMEVLLANSGCRITERLH